MHDQAEQLRVLAKTLKHRVECDIKGTKKVTRVIAVTSGKGGVGKTNFTVNFALALTALGQKVIILDADLGLANIDVILGVTPEYNLYHVLKGERDLKEIITAGPQGLQIIAGGSGMQELANLRRWQVEQFIGKLEQLEGMADTLIIDTAAGLSRNVMSFLLASDEVIVITTPEPTAITDAYGLVKAMNSKKKQAVVHLVVNKVENAQEADITANKFLIVAEKFLRLNIGQLGFILEDPHVSKSVKMQEPFLLKFPTASASKCVQRIAAQMLNQVYTPEPGGVKAFFGKIMKFWG